MGGNAAAVKYVLGGKYTSQPGMLINQHFVIHDFNVFAAKIPEIWAVSQILTAFGSF